MGLRFRKSVKLGPFRATVSKSGVSYSAGSKFGRVTKRADGKTQTTATIPGTGISHVTVSGGSSNSTPGGKTPKKGGFMGPLIAAVMVALLAVGCMAGGDEEPLAKLCRVDGQIKKILSWVFGGENDFDALLGGVNLLAAASNGQPVVTNLLQALLPVLTEGARMCAGVQVQQAKEKAQSRRQSQC